MTEDSGKDFVKDKMKKLNRQRNNKDEKELDEFIKMKKWLLIGIGLITLGIFLSLFK